MGNFRYILLGGVFLLLAGTPVAAQTDALVGTVRDAQQAAIPNATVTLSNLDTGIAQTTRADSAGSYEFPQVRPGNYSIKVAQPGFQTYVQSPIVLAVTQRTRVDIPMQVGETFSQVTVEATPSALQTESSGLGDVVDTKKIVEIPLNGRFFLDLALMTAGTVLPSTNNRTFLAVPSGIGASGINAAGTREDSTNYLFDGINLSDMAQNQITFQPNVDSIQEFKVQTNAFSAEYGRNAGIVVNAVSKQGTNSFHGSVWEFVRNEKFDAKNFFDRPDLPIPAFKRNIYGYSVGGPVIKNKTFFFTSYEGREGREVATLNSQVPTAGQRAGVTSPIVQKLLGLIPAANNATGDRYVGSAPRKRELNQFTGRIDHNFSAKDFLFGNFISNRDSRTEPTLQGGTLPGSGDLRPAKRYLLALGYTRVITPNVMNEFRAGLNRVHIEFTPEVLGKLNPADFGLNTGSAVFPQITISGVAQFAGISGATGNAGFPQGRGDTTFQYNDTLSWVTGRHSFKFGGELRRFRNNNFNSGTGGTITFPSLAAFLAGTPSSAGQARLPVNNSMRVSAFDAFAQDDFKMNSRLTLNLGLRWEYNGVPNEVYNRLGVFDFKSNSLISVNTNGIERPYARQFTNFGPRAGFAYDVTGKSKTVIRGGVGLYYDQPVVNVVSGLSSNPPFSLAVNFTSNVSLANPFSQPGGTPATVAAQAVDPHFKSGRLLSYNFNIQQDVLGTVVQVTYAGSQGRHLRITGDYNQGISGVRPIAGFSSINLNESAASSNYNGLFVSANRRLSKGLTFQTSYAFSKSIDTNSVGSSNPEAQNFRNLQAERALSDFDVRHRFVLSGVYLLPFKGKGALLERVAEGWSISPILNLQSGNPFSPVIPLLADGSGSLEAFDRPDVVPGQAVTLANQTPDLFFNKLAFVRHPRGFGNAGRNIIHGPGFQNVDFSVAKNTHIKERINLQFRAEVFNILNHPNFGQPNRTVTSADFGRITATRTARGDLGSSRQIQLGLKLNF